MFVRTRDIGSSGAPKRTLVAGKEESARRQQFIIKVSSWRFYNQQEVLNEKSLRVIGRFVFNNLAVDNAGNRQHDFYFQSSSE